MHVKSRKYLAKLIWGVGVVASIGCAWGEGVSHKLSTDHAINQAQMNHKHKLDTSTLPLIPGVTNIIVSPDGSSALYANNVELEKVHVLVCGAENMPTPTPTNNGHVALFTSANGGVLQYNPLSVYSDTNHLPNADGFFLYDENSPYVQLYKKIGFTVGGVAPTKTENAKQKHALDNMKRNDSKNYKDIPGCVGAHNQYQYYVYVRADTSASIGSFSIIGRARKQDGTVVGGSTQDNSLQTVRPIHYDKSDFSASVQYSSSAYVPSGILPAQIYHYLSDEPTHAQIVDFAIDQHSTGEATPKDCLGGYKKYTINGSPQLYGSNFSMMDVDCRVNGLPFQPVHSDPSKFTYYEALTRVSMNTAAATQVQTMSASRPMGYNGRSGVFNCEIGYGKNPDDQANTYIINNYYKVGEIPPNSEDSYFKYYPSLKGGVGVGYSNGTKLNDHVFGVQVVFRHNSDIHLPDTTATQDFGCSEMKLVPVFGYDNYGNKFHLLIQPGMVPAINSGSTYGRSPPHIFN